jgi:NAD(P)-dependent dehydrogenase (short-subunit alcohol dehydrogenase family)
MANSNRTVNASGRLAGKVAIVTGSGTGIGEAIALKFAAEGARVVVNGLPGDPVDEVVGTILKSGGQAVGFVGDVADEDGAQACVRAAIDEFDQLDILVNNAGVFLDATETPDYDVETFDQTMRMNCRSAFLMTKYALPHLKKTKGNIVSAGSESGDHGLAMNTPYGGTKGWMHAFMKGVAAEQGKYGIRANCVCPGPIDTAWTHKETGPMDRKMEKMTTDGTILGRRGTTEEIANCYAFIASDEASYVTGSLFFADGGTTTAKGAQGKEAERDVKREPEPSLPVSHERQGARAPGTRPRK